MVQAPEGAPSARLHGPGPDRVRCGRPLPQRARRPALPRAVPALGDVLAAYRAALRAGRRTRTGGPADPFPAGLTPLAGPLIASPDRRTFMSVGTIFQVQIVGGVLLFALIAKWYWAPRLARLPLEGAGDLIDAFVQGLRVEMARYHLGVAWYIFTVLVPALLVTHALIAVRLSRRADTQNRVPLDQRMAA